uniref:Uncharacterized protein n=1 Tax=Aegilops tauschii subsp. strangulata TaxID=200361 RepID=A0A453BY07_AEGTS
RRSCSSHARRTGGSSCLCTLRPVADASPARDHAPQRPWRKTRKASAL